MMIPEEQLLYSYSIHRQPGQRLGLKLASTDDGRGGTFVSELLPGGVAEPSGLRPGDMIISVNGLDVRSLDHGQVVGMFGAGERFDLEVLRPKYLESDDFKLVNLVRGRWEHLQPLQRALCCGGSVPRLTAHPFTEPQWCRRTQLRVGAGGRPQLRRTGRRLCDILRGGRTCRPFWGTAAWRSRGCGERRRCGACGCDCSGGTAAGC